MGKVLIGIRGEEGNFEVQSKWEHATIPELSIALAHLEAQKQRLVETIMKLSVQSEKKD